MDKIGVREIAKFAGVSPGTVDRALHGRKGIHPETRKRILAAAERLGYSPDLAARALSAGRAPVTVGVAIPSEIHQYFDYLLEGILSEARSFERLGIQILYNPTAREGHDDVERVEELLEAGPAAIILTPGSSEELLPLIDCAESKGVRVICVDRDVPPCSRSSFVGVNPEVCGNLAAELLAGCIPKASDVLVVAGMLDIEDHARRTEAFCKLYSDSNRGAGKVQVVEAREDEEEAFQKCFAALSEGTSFAGVYVSTVNCLPVCRAICARGLSGKVRLIASDLFREMAPYFEKGTIFASIHGRPLAQGKTALRMAVDHIVNGAPLPRTRYLLPHVVMRSNFQLFAEIREPARDLTGAAAVTVMSVPVR